MWFSVEATVSPDLSPGQQHLLKTKPEVKQLQVSAAKASENICRERLYCSCQYWGAPENEGVLLKIGCDVLLHWPPLCEHLHSFCDCSKPSDTSRVSVKAGNLHTGSFPAFISIQQWEDTLCCAHTSACTCTADGSIESFIGGWSEHNGFKFIFFQ